MKKILIIPISLLFLTACAKVESTDSQTKTQIEEQKDNGSSFEIKEEKTSDGWTRRVGREGIIGYKDKEITLTGKVVEEEVMGTWKYFFKVSEERQENLPAEFVEKMNKRNFLKYFSLYFNGKDVTDNYKGKEITITSESIGIPSEGMPRLTLKQLP